MALKRRAAAVDSDSEAGGSQASKRARPAVDSDVEEAPEASGSRSKSRRQEPVDEPADVGDDHEELDQGEPDEEEEKRFEKEHEEVIRSKVIGGHKAQGNIAEMGIIEKLELVQFMCHKYLVFTFGPQINFIIGHNGSGKSAVLSALTVALGGKATVTGRGSGLKSFIREGADAAQVTVSIKNQGEDAYKHNEYGDSIVIQRKFTAQGNSSYKIMSKAGKTISTKREELSNICDHMNIQVDNPMNILTQDSARQFLSASQPADKYRFFLKGTQLSQLSEEYSTCMENISQTQKVLANKSEAIPDLEAALEDVKARFREADKARRQKHKADELTKELAWSYVAEKEQEFRNSRLEMEKQDRRVNEALEKLERSKAKVALASELVTKYEEETAALGDVDDLESEKADVQAQIKAKNSQMAQLHNGAREMNDELQVIKHEIASAKEQIEKETKRMEELNAGKREETRQQLDEAIAAYQAAEAEVIRLKNAYEQEAREQQENASRRDALTAELERHRASITSEQSRLQLLQQRERTKLAPFGNNLDTVVAEIPTLRWHGQPPVGPLGQYVKVRDPHWASLVRARIGNLMGHFAITDARDRPQLEQLLKRHGNPSPNIVIAQVDMFDYSRGEPPAEFVTALRAIEVSDEYVLRVLINSTNAESILLADTRADADRLLQRLHAATGRGGVAWTGDSYTVERYSEGGGRSSLAAQLRTGDRREQMFTNDDFSAQRQRFQDALRAAETNYNRVSQQLRDCNATISRWNQRSQQLKTQIRQAEQQTRQLRTTRDALQDEVNAALPVSLQALHDAIKTSEEQKTSTERQFEELVRSKEKLAEELTPLLVKRDALKARLEEHDHERQRLTLAIEQAVEDRVKAQGAQKYWEEKVDNERGKLDIAKEKADVNETELAEWTTNAMKFCESWDKPRPSAEVKRNLTAIERALEQRERRQGATVEELTAEVNKKQAAVDNAKKDLKLMMQLNKSLRKSLQMRLTRWHEFRRHIALRCKIYFQYHLSSRGYFGNVMFDHVNNTLQLKVQTDDQIGTQGSNREKDPSSLSGGEKSFSTICLLLSLWESIGCPIRCLDEFDVFMDAVNRRISMKMMIDTANASDRKQYILITPQDMTNVQIGNTVRVHRMTDPERGQVVLNF